MNNLLLLIKSIEPYFPTFAAMWEQVMERTFIPIPVFAGINLRAVQDVRAAIPNVLSKIENDTSLSPVPKKKEVAKKRKPILLRFSTQDQILFSKRLSMMLRSGMPIMEGLHMLKDEARGGSAIYIYKSITQD